MYGMEYTKKYMLKTKTKRIKVEMSSFNFNHGMARKRVVESKIVCLTTKVEQDSLGARKLKCMKYIQLKSILAIIRFFFYLFFYFYSYFILPSCVSSKMMDACTIYRNLKLDSCKVCPKCVRVNVSSYLMN